MYARNGRRGSDAFMEGARASGFRVLQYRPPLGPLSTDKDFNVSGVVVDGMRRENPHLVRLYESHGVPCYIVELPRLRVCLEDPNQEGKSWGFYRSHLNSLPEKAGNSAVVGGLLFSTYQYVLICAQKPLDKQHGMDHKECREWARQTVAKCREQFPDKQIMYRPHPKQWDDGVKEYGADRMSEHSTIREALAESFCVVTHNSTTGVDAIDAGIPVFYTADESEVAYSDYSSRLGESIRVLSESEREECLLRFAASQWTDDQLREGIAARCLFGGEPLPEGRLYVKGRTADTHESGYTPAAAVVPSLEAA